MSVLTAAHLSQSFGPYDVFSGISAEIPHGGKVGLVGPNGVGKTTLLRILAGLDRPKSGGVYLAQGTRLGYLHQEAVQTFAGQDNTLYEEMLTVFAELQVKETQLRKLEARMASGETSEALLEKYSAVQEAYEFEGGYEYENRIEQVLTGLDFEKEDYKMSLNHLSGGQKTRALLARLLLEEPDLLILDEPTNHLDVQAVEWLEKALQQWPGALLIVSHDRYFLDKVVNTIWEMSQTHIEIYRGNYSAYAQQRQERWARREKEFEAKKEHLDKEMAFIYKHIGSGRGRHMAKGKLRRISDELGTEGKAISVARAKTKLKALRRPAGEWAQMRVKLSAAPRSGKIVLSTHKLQVGYDTPLFKTDGIKLYRGECAALIGPNGAGKTTFLRTILGQLEPLAGSVRLGASLEVGYFAQAHNTLDPEKTIIEELCSHHLMSQAEARNYLAQYLFRQDDVFKPVKALSGGERGRLALAILALKGANFLLLDEPTNHLDIPAQEVLQAGLERFEGTILLVSHDRYLIDRLATQIWDLRNGCLTVFEGDYRAFLAQGENNGTNKDNSAHKIKLAMNNESVGM
jgi:ATP-binding cassette subfamily F protein 3